MDDTLVVEVLQAVEDLGEVDTDEILREFAVRLANRVEGAVLAVPVVCISRGWPSGVSIWSTAYSRMMFKQSTDLTKPMYLTMLSC